MNALQSFIASKPMGFITSADLPELIKLDRLCPLLVRIGGGRFTCAAQDLEHLTACVIAGGDYVRDVSFPVGSTERAAAWQPDCPFTPKLSPGFIAKQIAKSSNRTVAINYPQFNESACGGVFDGFSVSSDADPGL